MKKVIIGFVIFLLFTNCNDSINENASFIDERVIGEWGAVTHIEREEYPGPSKRFLGLQILESELNYISIQHSTGKIKLYENSQPIKLKFLGNNQFETERLTYNGLYKQTIAYSFSNDSLILDYGHYLRKFEKVKLDSAIFEPVYSYLKFEYEDKIYQNISISSSISAYASIVSDNELILASYSETDGINIKLHNFKGEGYYRAPNFDIEITELGGDVISIYTLIGDSTSIGELRITNFDETNNKCSGKFSFTDYSYSEDSSPRYFDIRNGEFTLPIFK